MKVRSPDSDIFWILLHHAHTICCTVLFETGVGNKKRLINVTDLASHYGPNSCSAMLGLHSYSGCDTVSAFKGKGKVQALKLLLKTPLYSSAFQRLGDSWEVDEELQVKLEMFTCALYGKPKFSSTDSLRYFLIQKKCSSDSLTWSSTANVDLSRLPPSQECLKMHMRRANFQARIWRLANTACYALPQLCEGNGWTAEGEPFWCHQKQFCPSPLSNC